MSFKCKSLIQGRSIFWILLGTAYAGSISTWWYPEALAPQVIMYDETSGSIFYSLCNSNNTPIFPANQTAAFDLDPNFPPINGTSVAGTGYMLNGVYIAAIHYQEKNGGIVHSLWTCDSTGHYFKNTDAGQASWNVSAGIGAPEIHRQTGLSVVNLGGDEEIGGFRVYFKDAENRTAALRYTIRGGWAYDGFISQDTAMSLSITASFKDANHIIVLSASLPTADTQTIEVSTLKSANSWEINTFPWLLNAVNSTDDSQWLESPITNNTNTTEWFLVYNANSPPNWTFDAFDGKKTSLALSVDSSTNQSVYYIGTDAGLHGLTGYNTTWNKTVREPDSNWPLADNPNAPLALAHDATRNRTWIYYVSNGTMTQIHQSNGTMWEEATALPKFNSTAPENTHSSRSSSGLSNGVKIGIGIGIGLGVPFLIVILILYMYFHHKHSRENRCAEREVMEVAHADANNLPIAVTPYSPRTHSSMPGSPAPGYTSGYWEGGHWANGQWVPASAQGYYDPASGKPEGDWRQSHGYHSNGHESVALNTSYEPLYELPNQEYRHEMTGDGQVPEMPGTEAQAVAEIHHTQEPKNAQ